MEEIDGLKYTAGVISETLRLFPPAPVIRREAGKTVEVSIRRSRKNDNQIPCLLQSSRAAC